MFIVLHDYVIIIVFVILCALCMTIWFLIKECDKQKSRVCELAQILMIAELQTRIPYYSAVSAAKLPYENSDWFCSQLCSNITGNITGNIKDKDNNCID